MKKIIIANWKMNPTSFQETRKLLSQLLIAKRQLPSIKFVTCPPFIYLSQTKNSNLQFGAQNCFWEDKGAYTGEISPLMLKKLGVKYVIIGHSERKKFLKEDDEMIAKKIKAVVKNKLIPVLCVGETLKQRKKGLTKKVLKDQLTKSLRVKELYEIIIAYEPIWAIGAGKSCQPEHVLEMIKFIKSILNSKFTSEASFTNSKPIQNSKLLYGGSVNAKNILDFLKHKEIDGVLIGGTSSNIKEFNEILKKLKS